MSTNLKLTAPYLRSSWQFPDDNAQALSVQVDRAYLAIANTVNAREISIYPTSVPIANGTQWFINSSQKQSGLRRVYVFTAAGSIAHNLDFNSIAGFTQCYGTFTDGTNWYGAVFGSNTAIAAQISFYLTPTSIVILAGVGSPAITTGTIVLEWRSQL